MGVPSPPFTFQRLLSCPCLYLFLRPIKFFKGSSILQFFNSPIPLLNSLHALSQLPTPIHRWNLPNLPPNTELWIKVCCPIRMHPLPLFYSFFLPHSLTSSYCCLARRPFRNAAQWKQSQEIGVPDGRRRCAGCRLCHHHRRHPEQPLSRHCRRR